MNEINMADPDKTAIGTFDIADRTAMISSPNPTMMAANVKCPVCSAQNPPSEMYCIDCGFLLTSQPVDMSEIEIVSFGKLISTDGTREFNLTNAISSVGRESSDILLSDNAISRRHAQIVAENGKVFAEDLGSTNGTQVDRVRLSQGNRVELKDGAEIAFASITFKYAAPEAVEETPKESSEEILQAEPEETLADSIPTAVEAIAPSFDAGEEAIKEAEAPKPAFILDSKDGAYHFEIIQGDYKIGRRSNENAFVIADSYCSGRHADIAFENNQLVITDIGSTNGTYINGVKLEPNTSRTLTNGDELTVGRVVFNVVESQSQEVSND